MSRLEFAPKLKEVDVTDVKNGVGIFAPKPGSRVSFAALRTALRRAGYKLASAELTAAGTLRRDGPRWTLVVDGSGQVFGLEGRLPDDSQQDAGEGARVEVVGDWKTSGEGSAAREVVAPASVKKIEDTPAEAGGVRAGARSAGGRIVGAVLVPARFVDGRTGRRGVDGTRGPGQALPRQADRAGRPGWEASPGGRALAPIRTTSPGLTVYRGGAVTPRVSLTRQHLGGLEVSRQSFNVSVSYTPTPRLQLEAEVPFSRTSFDDGESAGGGAGLGNATVWGKYRFYRAVERWGDRQAAARFGLELPTGKPDAPTEARLRAPAYVRQQLTPISGGLAARLDAAYSQARGRLIFGGNAEGVLRAARAGFRTGHELRVNTDLEYVLFPFKYRRPTGELFAIVETSFVRRWTGRVGGAEVEGSRSTEFYVAPALQYVATSRVVFEGSLQLPVVRRTGPQVLRTSGNVLLGMRYLF